MLPPNYNLYAYGTHIRDMVRTKAYIAALKRAMFPGAVVIDIGAGTGFFSLLACQLGAGHVYAIEPNPLVELLEKQANINGYADRLTVIRKMSVDVELPELADIVIADLRGGMFPLHQSSVLSLYDVRQRLMKEDGVLIPERDLIYVAVVQNEEMYRKQVLTPWVEDNYGVDMSLSLPLALNSPIRGIPAPEKILLPGQLWAEVCYGIQKEPSVKSAVTWSVERPGTAHFIATWFEAHLLEGITYSNKPTVPPRQRPNTYGGTFFPLEAPVSLVLGDTMTVMLHASYVALSHTYNFIWEILVKGDNGDDKIRFRQSDFFNQQFNIANKIPSATPIPIKEEESSGSR
jgi:type I protein arginine methyltransferase